MGLGGKEQDEQELGGMEQGLGEQGLGDKEQGQGGQGQGGKEQGGVWWICQGRFHLRISHQHGIGGIHLRNNRQFVCDNRVIQQYIVL